MAHANKSVSEPRRQAFEQAKQGIAPEVIDRVMRGLPTENDGIEPVRTLRQTWSQYHECM